MTRILLISLFLISLVSCNQNKCNETLTYFGGQIVNPTSDFVLLLNQENQVLDSLKLSDDNSFLFKIADLKEGMYHFQHAPEHQYIYLERGDSLMMRLNTIEFDESLVFSGKGEELNNFLLEYFLNSETQRPKIKSYYKLSAIAFTSKLDSIKELNEKNLDELLAQIEVSEKAMAILNAQINYMNYEYREQYPYMHKKKLGLKKIDPLPENYYNFRKNVNFNDKNLVYYKPYYNYIKTYLSSKSYINCVNYCETSSNGNDGTLHYYMHKLTLIDSLIQQHILRDNLFRYTATDYFLREDNNTKNNSIFIKKFQELTENSEHKKDVLELYTALQAIQKGKDFPKTTVFNNKGEQIVLTADKKAKATVYYFWSNTQPSHLKNIHQKIDNYKVEYPNYKFVGISLFTEYSKWLNLVETMKLDKENQYQSRDHKKLRSTFFIKNLNKAIIVNNNNVIIDAFSNIQYKRFEKTLQKLAAK